MKFTTRKGSLLKGLTVASRAVNSKSMQAIMGCVLIEAGDDIKLTGNNTEIGIQTAIEGEVIDSGSIATDAKILLDIVKKMPDGEMSLSTEGEELRIKGGKAKFSIPFRGSDDFPSLVDPGNGTHVSVDSRQFKDMVRQVAFATLENSSQKAMEGINLSFKDREMTMTALDGHRIAVRSTVIDSQNEVSAIVPCKTMREAASIMDDGKTDIYVTENYMTFLFDDTTIISRLIDGKFWDINQLIRGDFGLEVSVKRSDLYNCVDRATLFSKEGDKKPIIVDITDKMNVQIKTHMGSMNEDIDVAINGNGIKIGFNPRFWIDALSVIEDDEITIYLKDPKSPVLIKDEQETYKYLILPVNF